MAKPDYDTTLARIAGNIASGLCRRFESTNWSDRAMRELADDAVRIARLIVAKCKADGSPTPASGAQGSRDPRQEP